MRRNLRIGISGPQGSGKSTLAKELAKSYDIEYIPSDVGGFIKSEIGDKNPDEFSYCDRLKLHSAILNYLIDKFSSKDNYVTDRTTLDVIGYNLAFAPANIEADKEIFGLYELCKKKSIQTLKIMYDHVIITTPLNDLKPDNRKTYRAPIDTLSIEKMNTIMVGLSFLVPQSFIIIPPNCQDLQQRISYCTNIIDIPSLQP